MSLPVVLIHGFSSEGKTAADGVLTVQRVGAIDDRLVEVRPMRLPRRVAFILR